MKSEELYEAWKETKRKVISSESFENNVMNQIYKHERERKETPFGTKRLIDFVSAHSFAQAALVAIGFMAGFMRMVFIIVTILNKGDING